LSWTREDEFPNVPLLVHDGMGSAGPSAYAIPKAEAQGFPTLFTGHLPEGSPGAISMQNGFGDWKRLPTHPTLGENQALWEMAASPELLGHSCSVEALSGLTTHMPGLDAKARTGQTYDIPERSK